MQNRIKSAKALVDIACEKSHTGNWIFDEFEIEDVFGFSPTEEDIENIAKKAYEDGRVADVLYYPAKDHMGATTWYLDILIYTDYCENLEDDDLEDDKVYVIRDREAGNIIDYFDTLEEAQTALKEYEEDDLKNGIYEEDFYEIAKADICEDEYLDYSQNMPCDNYGMGACSPSCPKFYECN